jgi:DNA-binding CsgD family transcriptional regulator
MRRIDDRILLEMYDDGKGKSQKEIAEYFGVSGPAICKRLKRLTAPPEEPLKIESLTAKERTFCLEMAAGKSQTQAALTAYDVSNRESAKSLGHTLMKNGDIQEAKRN